MTKQVIIDIDAQGNTTVSVKGVKGASCTDLTKQIERALGKTASDKKTPEYHEQVAARREVRQ